MDLYPEPLKNSLTHVDELISGVYNSDDALIREIGAYLSESQGKRLRPALAILAAEACGHAADIDVWRVAACVELFHAATLLHDDVIDKAQVRRGRPSVNAKWSDAVAVLMADYLYAKAFGLALSTSCAEALGLLCSVSARMCEGEMFQIEKGKAILTREDYLKIIQYKTAVLFSASVEMGGLIARANGETIGHLREYGLNFGMAFQITDDSLDYSAQHENWGKPVGGDVAEGKQTLPLIYTLEVATPEDRSALLGMLGNGRDFQGVLRQIQKYKGLDHSREVARSYADRASTALDGLPTANGHGQTLKRLCDYVVSRAF